MTDAPVADHPFHDEWRFQRTMTSGNPVAGKPIAPFQPCFDCGVLFKDHRPVADREPLSAEEARRAVEKWLAQWGIHNDAEIAGLLDAMAAAARPRPDEAGLREALRAWLDSHGEADIEERLAEAANEWLGETE